MTQKSKLVIGISGNGLVGKDVLCTAMIECFYRLFHLKAVRRSIAGDRVRKDLEELVESKFGINVHTPTDEEKTLIRPIMVEYGRIQRKVTGGRYFIDMFEPSGNIDIVPDIRYDEYEKDELSWITDEVKGFLVYLERDGILPANVYERENNKRIKERANLCINWPTFDDEDLKIEPLRYAKTIIEEWFKSDSTY